LATWFFLSIKFYLKMFKVFQKKREDFICERCGIKVFGDGYTNHCPACLWSKHVDINPGDRKERCQGMMRPIEIDIKKGKYRIVHKCIKCGLKKRNRIADNDDFDVVVKISGGEFK